MLHRGTLPLAASTSELHGRDRKATWIKSANQGLWEDTTHELWCFLRFSTVPRGQGDVRTLTANFGLVRSCLQYFDTFYSILICTYTYTRKYKDTMCYHTHTENCFATGILRISRFRAAHGTFHQSKNWLLGSRVESWTDLYLVTIFQAACWLWGSCNCDFAAAWTLS